MISVKQFGIDVKKSNWFEDFEYGCFRTSLNNCDVVIESDKIYNIRIYNNVKLTTGKCKTIRSNDCCEIDCQIECTINCEYSNKIYSGFNSIIRCLGKNQIIASANSLINCESKNTITVGQNCMIHGCNRNLILPFGNCIYSNTKGFLQLIPEKFNYIDIDYNHIILNSIVVDYVENKFGYLDFHSDYGTFSIDSPKNANLIQAIISKNMTKILMLDNEEDHDFVSFIAKNIDFI